MKTVQLLLLGLTLALAYSLEDGSFEGMTKKAVQENIKTRSDGENAVYFSLFTNNNPSSPQDINPQDAATLKNSNFNRDNPTRIIIHGWLGDNKTEANILLLKAYLDTGKYNIISFDWSAEADNIFYPTSANKTSSVGKRVAQFIDFLNKEGNMSFEDLAVIGFSLGAHVAGHAGKNVKNGRIAQIIGLDPANPEFEIEKPDDRLSESDAEYVETIQTSGSGLIQFGFKEPIGKSVFYPDGGQQQKGCLKQIALTCIGSPLSKECMERAASCSHQRAYEYFEEAIRHNNFPAIKCDNYQQAHKEACGSNYSSVKMGDPNNYKNPNAKGVFYVPVNGEPPYGKEK